jgi:hypothetical protein
MFEGREGDDVMRQGGLDESNCEPGMCVFPKQQAMQPLELGAL